MNALEKIREWIKTYPGFDVMEDFQVDYTDQVPNTAGMFPDGLVEISRRQDIMGDVTVTNQYNFALHCLFEKATRDSEGAKANADWVSDFQEWVQEQSALGLAPVFGDRPRLEKIKAQNGALYQTDREGTALYVVQLSVQFVKKYRRVNNAR